MSIKAIVVVALLVMPLAAQEQGRSSTCTVHYENHNQAVKGRGQHPQIHERTPFGRGYA